MKTVLIFFLTIGFLSPAIFAQVVQVDFGRVKEVEFIGLEKWTPDMILEKLTGCTDSLCYRNNVFRIGCNFCLKKALPFPEIHAHTTRTDRKTLSVAITVVEPQYADQIKYLQLPPDSNATNEKWRSLISVCDMADANFQVAVQLYRRLYFGKSTTFVDSVLSDLENQWDAKKIRNVWETIYSFHEQSDFEDAVADLRSDRNVANRMAATCILLNFLNEESLGLLLDLLRTKVVDERLIGLAEMVVRSFSNSNLPHLDILKMEKSLAPILRGTNVGSFMLVVDLLSKIPELSDSEKRFIKSNINRLGTAYLHSKTYGKEMENALNKMGLSL